MDTKLERDVALKLLRPEAMGDPAAKERFIQEARAASAFRGVVKTNSLIKNC